MFFLIVMCNLGWWLVSGVVGCYYVRFWLIDEFLVDEIFVG